MIAFSVPGRPTPTARPRVLRNGGAFTPKPTVLAQRAVGEAALAAAGGKRPLWPSACLSVQIQALFAWPKGTPKKRIPVGNVPMAGRPDLDNLAKTILDGCMGVLFTDDSQIVELTISKWRTPDPADAGFYVEFDEMTER